jgi:hypothetical protein
MSFMDYTKMDTVTPETARVMLVRNIGRFTPLGSLYKKFFRAAVVMAAASLPIMVIAFPIQDMMGRGPHNLTLPIIWSVCAVVADAASIVAQVIFYVWYYRAARNMYAFNYASPRFNPGWSVAFFFIPFANLVVPYFVTRQMLDRSGRYKSDLPGALPPAEQPRKWLNWWWASMLVPIITGLALFYYTVGSIMGLTRPGVFLWFDILVKINILLPVLRCAASAMVIRQVNALQESTFKGMKEDPLVAGQHPG